MHLSQSIIFKIGIHHWQDKWESIEKCSCIAKRACIDCNSIQKHKLHFWPTRRLGTNEDQILEAWRIGLISTSKYISIKKQEDADFRCIMCGKKKWF